MRAFITGLEGFTGNYLAKELHDNGYEVFGSVHRADNVTVTTADVFPCDLNDETRLTKILADVKPDVVFHLAGISFTAHGCASEIYQVNLLGTLSLLQSISAAGCDCRKILLAGSAHAYGNQMRSPIAESYIPEPNSDYAVSKLAMEYVAKLWLEKLPIIITRPFNYTGVGQAPCFLPPKIVQHFVEKIPEIELGNIDVARDWSDVRDVAGIYRRLIESEVSGIVINVCSGVSHSLKYVLETMAEISGHSISVRINPEFVRRNEVKELWGDNDLLKSIIGDVPLRPLHETLRWMYESELERMFGGQKYS